MDVPLPWERLLWSGRSLSLHRTRHVLTDFRLVSIDNDPDELALYDIEAVSSAASIAERLLGRSTVTVQARDSRRPPLVLRRIRRGEQLAGVLELLAADPSDPPEAAVIRAALSSTPWQFRSRALRVRDALIGCAAVVALVFGVAIGLHGKTAAVVYAADDAIYPGGEKRDRETVIAYMESAVMPWAKKTLGPIVGGGERVRCETCHGEGGEARGWRMPGVAELPKPDVLEHGWEQYSSTMDAQMRNAIYGYVADSDNQARARYMREVVMPGMAALLHRPAYDFTKTYEFNRTRAAFGCYHCHNVRPDPE